MEFALRHLSAHQESTSPVRMAVVNCFDATVMPSSGSRPARIKLNFTSSGSTRSR